MTISHLALIPTCALERRERVSKDVPHLEGAILDDADAQ